MSFNPAGSLNGQRFSSTNRTNSSNGVQKTDTQTQTRQALRQFLANYTSDIGIPSETELKNALLNAGGKDRDGNYLMTNIQITINKYQENGKQVADVHVTFTWGGEDFDQSRRFELTPTGQALQPTFSNGNNEVTREPKIVNSQDFYKNIDAQATTTSDKINAYKYFNRL